MINFFAFNYNTFLFYGSSLIGVFLCYFIMRKWQVGILMVFFLLFLQDFIRKITPGQPYQVLLFSDVLIVFTYISFLISWYKKKKGLWKPPFFVALILFVIWCIIEIFNPHIPSMWFAVAGLRGYLFYLPLIFLGYSFFLQRERFLLFCRVLAYMSIVLTVVAIIQNTFFYSLPPEFVQPLDSGHDIHYFESGKIKLVPSLFSSGERLASTSLFLFLLSLGLLYYYKDQSFKGKALLFISTIAAPVGIFLSGRRTAMYLTVPIVLVWLVINYKDQIWDLLRFKFNKSLMVTIFIFLTVILVVFISLKDTRNYFIRSFPSIGIRSSLAVKEIMLASKTSGFLGGGIGIRSQGIHYIPGGQQWYDETINIKSLGIESGIGRVLLELGFVGLGLFILFYGQMVYYWLREVIRLRGSSFYYIGLGLLLYFLSMMIWFLKGHQIFGDSSVLILFWFFGGVIFNLKNLVSLYGK